MSAEIRFAPRNDGTEEDCQCARCGSSVTFIRCDNCGGSGSIDPDTEGDWEGGYVDGSEVCEVCDGKRGWWQCLSSEAFCTERPIAGRNHIKRGQVEWFVIERGV